MNAKKWKILSSRRCLKETERRVRDEEGGDQVDAPRSGLLREGHVDSQRSGLLRESHVDAPRSGLLRESQDDAPRSGLLREGHVDSQRSGLLRESHVDSKQSALLIAKPDDTPETAHEYPFSYRDGIAVILSCLFFLSDVVSDILLAREYFVHGRTWEFLVTTLFIVFPAVLTSTISMVWFCEQKEKRRQFCSAKWICKFIFTILPTAPLVRNLLYVYHGRQSKKKKDPKSREDHYSEMILEDRDASMLRMFDAFLESAPQLVLQVYVTITEKESDKDEHLRIIRSSAMFLSLVGVSWSVTSYYRALRISLLNPEDTHREGSFCMIVGYFYWRAFEIGPRIVAIAMFASQFSYFVSAFIFFHWTVMLIWLTYQKVDFYKKWRDNFLFVFVIGFVQIFAFINVGEGQTRLRAMLYYLIFYTENFIFLAVWICVPSELPVWSYYLGIVVIPSGLILHIAFLLMFYHCCHPKSKQINTC